MMDAFYLTLDASEFQVYSCADILQLSVKQLTNSQTFDLLENPVEGGLHDPALGPISRDDRCESCGQSESNCPGHFGHIKLPVLLFNPILFKSLVVLLQGTCMSCHQIMLPSFLVKGYQLALSLLRGGVIADAQIILDDYLKSSGNEAGVADGMKFYFDKYKHIKSSGKAQSKHVLTLLRATLKVIFDHLKKSKRVCCHCREKNRALTAEFNRSIIGTLSASKQSIEEIEMHQHAKEAKERRDTGNPTKGDEDIETLPEEDIEMDGTVLKEDPDEEQGEEMMHLQDVVQMQTEIDQFLKSPHKRCILSPYVAQVLLRQVWKKEKKFLKAIFPFLAEVSGLEYATDVFFTDVIPVGPSRFRPLNVIKGHKYEHQQTSKLAKVIAECDTLNELLSSYSASKSSQGVIETAQVAESEESISAIMRNIMSSWLRLQTIVNTILDCTLDKMNRDVPGGVKQKLEKKEGIFRMNMMGKRVNFAARSVISPDPYIAVNQIGIPVVFASKLTYPQPVTPWNVHLLRKLVINGPYKYPGAFSVINEDGSIIRLSSKDEVQREAVANQLLVPDKDTSGHKIVCRHLLNGDYLLLNRQPSLHRPSIQAHKARVLHGIKTLRLHYSNCKAYNADFDGDEMNVHFPQDEIGRAEAATLACTDFQYLVPKDGTPLGGLIQDHMVAGVKLTTRGRFFNRRDYSGLIWSAMNDWTDKLELLPPSILKPEPLWSGKQVISTILLNIIPKDQAPLNLSSKAKIPEKSWFSPDFVHHHLLTPINLLAWASNELGESTVVIRQGELLQGVLDKAHYGPSAYGLVHCCYELYGGIVAGKLLTYLGRLFTNYLQIIGFSLGVGDILVLKPANKKRRSIIKKTHQAGRQGVVKGLTLGKDVEMTDVEVLEAMKAAQFDKEGLKLAEIDMYMKAETDRVTDGISKSIMPVGLEKKFPENGLQLMVQSGAKGSPVNCMQISCLLGQIELEGRRPPLMMSGRSLPCFLPYDVSPQAGGFVSGRFLTGIRPAEYFYHCMAGREGLIDTAVKTSRSGYLQRCLVKHLEGIMVNYDLTVRDSDGGVLQFYYGEDGLEPTRSSCLKPSQFPFLTENLSALHIDGPSLWLSPDYSKSVRRTWKKISKWKSHTKQSGSWVSRQNGFHQFCESQDPSVISEDEKKTLVRQGNFQGHSEASKKLFELWFKLDKDQREELLQTKSCPDPVMSKHLPHSQPDIMSENFRHLVNVYCKKGLNKVKSNLPGYADVDPDMFKTAVNKKLVQALAHPGEAVGLLCAQSVGEPSTQMTLNTFHFAGRGEMNVTLGIPRMREILMTGSVPKTPQVDVPIRPVPNAREEAEKLRAKLTRVTFNQFLEYAHFKITSVTNNGSNYKNVEITFKCLRHSQYKDICTMKYNDILNFVVTRLIPNILHAFKKENRILNMTSLLSSGKMRRSANTERDAEGSDPTDDADMADEMDETMTEPNDGDAATVKEQQRRMDTNEYEGEDEEKDAVGENDDDDDADVDNTITEKVDESDEEEENEVPSRQDHIALEDLSDHYQKLREKAMTHSNVIDMNFTDKKKRSFTLTFQFPPEELQFDIRLMFERFTKSLVAHHVEGIKQAFITEETEDGETVLHLKTDGINMQYLFNFPDLLDLNRIYTNSINHMCQIYGIEAANRVIIKEVQNVFSAYGITVDYHHLSLLADYMTSRGQYDACNRNCISGIQTSTLQKITFETAMNFLTDACFSGHKDFLTSPSSQIVTGKPVGIGTGCFDIMGRH